MPKALAGFLIIGGALYMASTFVLVLLPNQSTLADSMSIPGTIGEFWIIGYLIIKHAMRRKESVGLHYMVNYSKEAVK